MARYVGKRKQEDEWQSQMLSRYSDMVIIEGEDKTDEIQYMNCDEKDAHRHIVYFVTGEIIEYCEPEEIIIFDNPKGVRIGNATVEIDGVSDEKPDFIVRFGDYRRIFYMNDDYQTVSADAVKISSKLNKVKNSADKPLIFTLHPEKWQKEKIDKKIEESDVREVSGIKVYEYEPNTSLEEMIKYKDKTTVVEIADIGDVKITFTDFPYGNCNKIHVKVVKSGEYKITFFCYKKVVGIDLGESAVICSTGKKYIFPYNKRLIKDEEKLEGIKKEWKESIAMQLLLDYDILFLEYLKCNEYTRQEFAFMLDFAGILIEKAKHFNRINPDEVYKKEICTLKKKYPSTQICHICGYRNTDLQNNVTKRSWMCPYCGTRHDRDINAAINILRKGMEEKMEQEI